jgi:phage shock protein PspC (stress-responsive transcriptional regulator)
MDDDDNPSPDDSALPDDPTAPGRGPEWPPPPDPASVAAGPDPIGPDTSGPDASGPDPIGPDTSGPDASGPDAGGPDASGPGTGGDGPRPLRRRRTGRLAGGVAGGIARSLDIDVAVVRLAFVALAFLGGSGILLYGAGWVLIPEEEDDEPLASQWLRADRARTPLRSRTSRIVAVVLVVIAVLLLAGSAPWGWHHGGLGWGWGVGTGLGTVVLLALIGGLLVLVFRGGSGSVAARLGRLLLIGVACLVTALALLTGAAFAAEALSGVPMHGGVGDSRWVPTSSGAVASRYQLAIGNLVVNLGSVSFAPGSEHSVTATVGMGHVLVEVPANTTVSVSAHSGVGDVSLFGRHDGGLDMAHTVVAAGGRGSAHLSLHVEAGVGQATVVRAPAA